MAIAAVVAVISLGAATARADVAGAVGADYYSGPSSQVTRGVLGIASVGVAGGFASVAGVRYDDTLVGPGFGVTAGVGAPLGGSDRLFRVLGTRYVGDGTYRAWRLKAGPFFQWNGSSLGVSFLRYVDDVGGEATGAIVEVETPVAPRWRATIDGSAAAIALGQRSVSASAGVAWTAARHLTLSAEAGVARNGTIAAPQPGGGARGMPGVTNLGTSTGGRGSAGRPDVTSGAGADVAATLQLGIRVPFP
ncbi:MAG: hypothetical protein ACM3JJ_12010 [Hyphomicrobiales bacterium]